MSCWLCGARAVVTGEIMSMETMTPVRVVYGWTAPARTDHQHAVQPPRPEDLELEGHRSLMRIYEEGRMADDPRVPSADLLLPTERIG